MLKAISDFVHRTHEALPAPVAATLKKASMDNLSHAITVARVAEFVYTKCREDPVKREIKEEAALLGRMRREPEKLRSLSPTSCSQAQEVSDRLLLRTTQANPSAEVIPFAEKKKKN